jgi:hypothetical protein
MTSPDFERERQRFAEVYAGKTDEELAEQGGTLTEPARVALKHELSRSQLHIKVQDSPTPQRHVELPGVVTLRQFLTVPGAVMAKSILDSAGIESFLADENVISVNWLWSNALGGVKLQVRATHEASASALLEEKLSEAAASTELDETAYE